MPVNSGLANKAGCYSISIGYQTSMGSPVSSIAYTVTMYDCNAPGGNITNCPSAPALPPVAPAPKAAPVAAPVAPAPKASVPVAAPAVAPVAPAPKAPTPVAAPVAPAPVASPVAPAPKAPAPVAAPVTSAPKATAPVASPTAPPPPTAPAPVYVPPPPTSPAPVFVAAPAQVTVVFSILFKVNGADLSSQENTIVLGSIKSAVAGVVGVSASDVNLNVKTNPTRRRDIAAGSYTADVSFATLGATSLANQAITSTSNQNNIISTANANIIRNLDGVAAPPSDSVAPGAAPSALVRVLVTSIVVPGNGNNNNNAPGSSSQTTPDPGQPVPIIPIVVGIVVPIVVIAVVVVVVIVIIKKRRASKNTYKPKPNSGGVVTEDDIMSRDKIEMIAAAQATPRADYNPAAVSSGFPDPPPNYGDSGYALPEYSLRSNSAAPAGMPRLPPPGAGPYGSNQ